MGIKIDIVVRGYLLKSVIMYQFMTVLERNLILAAKTPAGRAARGRQRAGETASTAPSGLLACI